MKHLRISHVLKCKTMLLIFPIHPQGMEREIRICPVVVGVKGSPTEGNSMQPSTYEFYTIKPRETWYVGWRSYTRDYDR